MSAKAFFVTGTDTGVGKTYVTTTILQAAKQAGYSTAAGKPVAAGGLATDNSLRNEDALLLQQACTLKLDYETINPVCLQRAIAPHIAAQEEGIGLDISQLAGAMQAVLSRQADLTLIEGAGGWRVPMEGKATLAELVRQLELPVILVVGMRLGCLNHALLSAEAIRRDGLQLHGWIANQLDPQMPVYQENIATLKNMLDAPLLASLSWQAKNPMQAIQLDSLLTD